MYVTVYESVLCSFVLVEWCICVQYGMESSTVLLQWLVMLLNTALNVAMALDS